MTEGNRVAVDFFGGLLSKFEWGFVYIFAKDEEGFVSKEAVRGLFDGSLFENVAAKIQKGAAVFSYSHNSLVLKEAVGKKKKRPMGKTKKEEAMATEAPLAPVTAERKVKSDLEDSIPKPYLARALAAPDSEHPDGTPGRENNGMTVLQQHVSYFDQDKIGIIYPWNTFRGLRALGLNLLISGMVTFVVNITLSFLTAPGWIPFPSLPIYIKNIHKAKHGSDTGTYDTEGRFVPVNFENIFSKYALTEPDKLKLRELWKMTEGYRVAMDFFGGFVTKFEWGLVYLIASDEEGFVSKEAVRGIFDGSFLEYVAEKKMTEMADNTSENISVKLRWCV